MKSKEYTREILDLDLLNEINRPKLESGDVFFLTGEEIADESQNNDLIAFNIANSFETVTYEEIANNGLSEPQLDIVVGRILSAITDIANAKTKGTPFVESNEIEKVKKILATEQCNSTAKQEIENELTRFQEEILLNYKKGLRENICKKFHYENEIKVLEDKRSQIVAKRIAQLQWPFDDETKAIDNKIYNFKCKIHSCEMKINNSQNLRPMAKENDITKFNMKLKAKFAN